MKIIESIWVKDLEGQEVDLISRYKDRALLIIIYNNRCLGCTGRAIPLAYEYQQKLKDLQVLGIHSNFGKEITSKQDIYNIFTSGQPPFPIYIDENHKVYDAFQAEGTPQWLLITSNGQLYRSIFGSQEGAQNRLSYALEVLLQGGDQ
ncbi:TlpA family protein disulfide reductase [Membranihabitans marinus]|uniref:TlpA family protein disulfide reductase n=1 Tax=Membranihabitans marinus TaxID=1227546 RepID=UPI001F41F901|nr:redoxin domain-containing protein [Membranihabitans marinus]